MDLVCSYDMYIPIYAGTRIPAGRLWKIFESYSQLVVFSVRIQQICYVEMEGIVAVWPATGILSVDIDTGIAHGTVEKYLYRFVGAEILDIKLRPVPAGSYIWKSSGTSGLQGGVLFKILCDGNDLGIVI